MAILDNGVFSAWNIAFDARERARARHKEAETLHSIELRAYTTGELDKANRQYLAAVAALDG